MITNLAANASSTAARPRRGVHIGLWVVQAVAAVGFISVAFAKFTHAPMVVEVFNAMGVGDWMPYTIGALEVVGAIALLIPRLCGVAATAFVALTVGAISTHLIFGGNPAAAVVMLVLSVIVAIGRRRSTAAFIESLKRTAR